MAASSPRSPGDSFKPAFGVGVTGHMDLDPTHRERIKAEIKRIFAWLRAPSCKHDKNEGDPTLGPGLGLKNTPIILLSSLAPGADQWVVETAQEMDPPLCVLAPLPFLKDQYLEASTFKRDGITKDEAASEFLAAFPDEDVFVVRLLDEIDLNDDALRAKHKSILTGPAGQEERDRRYAAAGEYVAAYGNLLIALTDRPIGQTENAFVHPGEGPGAQAIAELKRRGMTPGLLPDLPALSWADDGPVIHVYAPRRPIEVPGSAEKQGDLEAKTMELLYPYDCRPPDVSESQNDNPDWHKASHAILKVIAEHLERLNTEKIRIDPARQEKAFAEMLPGVADPAGKVRSHALTTASKQLKATLDRLARLRRRVADYSACYDGHLTRLKHALFGLAFCSAVLFSLADNWGATKGLSSLPQAFFATAFGLTLATWIAFFRFKKTAAVERCEDYRAVTEGLRVQFYWTACGIRESVASNYLQRQRGELGWIRHVISAPAFPHEANRMRFNQLSLNDQLVALRSIRKAWIGGQYTYFKDKIDELSLRRELFTTYAHVLLWTGFVLFAFFVFFPQSSESSVLPRPLALLPFAAGSLILAMLFQKTYSEKHASALDSTLTSKNEQPEKGRKNRKPESFISRHAKWLSSLPGMFLPERIRSPKGGNLILSSLLVVALTSLIIGAVYLCDGLAPWLPPAKNLGSIFKYLAFAGGVLCGAWVEVNFFAENIRRYASMASLFQAAGLRFDDYLNWSEQGSGEQKEAAQKQAVASIQSLIVAVGREALSENADWLVIRRARPLEPVSV
jgi:hypothetical protein